MAVKNFREAKEAMKGLLEKHYGTMPSPTLATLTDREVEEKGFMRAQDAEQVRKVASKEGYYVSFRAAGANTLKRIKAGHPCKGHNILTKSVKKTDKPNLNDWSYTLSAENKDFFKGLVGNPGTGTPPALEGIWALQMPVSLDKDFKKRKTTDVPLTLDEARKQIGYCYTGDYDMHDLMNAKGARIVPETVDERAAIDQLNRKLLRNDLPRWHNALRDLKNKGIISKDIMPYPKDTDVLPEPMLKELLGNYVKSSYALIRHGAQTSYMDFMFSDPEKKELIKMNNKALKNNLSMVLDEHPVITIDPHIVMFTLKGEVYELNGLSQIYAFFKKENLLNNIPFYYFFGALDKMTTLSSKDKVLLNECKAFIDNILRRYKE